MNAPDLPLLEWGANGLTAWCVWLAARGQVLTWPVGIAGSLLFGWLFFESRLYADATLQLFFIATSVRGWQQWHRHGGPADLSRLHEQGEGHLSAQRMAGLLLAGVVVTVAYGALLKHWTNAYAPYWDSAVLGSSVVAQLLLMRGHPATWPAWLVVNTLSVPLYLQRDLNLTAALYTAFWINAWYGWWRWHRSMALRTA